jgi:endonuclease YncB( thermonuclease family)
MKNCTDDVEPAGQTCEEWGNVMAERDIIVGVVTDVIDGETILVAWDRSGINNAHKYRDEERIHIRKIKLDKCAWLRGVFTKPMLERMFRGKQVMCLVYSREKGGRIVADVHVI